MTAFEHEDLRFDEELDALLDAERNIPSVSADVERRVQQRLERALGWGGGGGLLLERLATAGLVALGALATLAAAAVVVGPTHVEAPRSEETRAAPTESRMALLASVPPLQLLSGTAAPDATRINGAFEGTVVSADTGRPIEGAELVVLHDEQAFSTRSGRDGHFVFDAPVTGAYALAYVSATDFLPYAPEDEDENAVMLVARPGQAVRRIEIQLAPHTIAHGVVRDGAHQRVPGAEVRIVSPSRARADRTITDARGEFALALRPGDTVVAAHRASGWGATHLRIAQFAAPIEIALGLEGEPPSFESASAKSAPNGAPGKLHGHVFSAANHAPVSAFTIVVWSSHGALERDAVARRSFFDSAGEYEISGLLPGTYTLMALARDLAPRSTEISIGEDDLTRDLELEPGARVHGEVYDEGTRAPIEGARVSLELLLEGDHAVALSGGTTTDKNGHFDLGGMMPGRASLVVADGAHDGRLVSGLDAKANDSIGPLRIDLARPRPGERPRFELTGIGAALTGRDDALIVDKVLEEGAAREAGLREGDAIIAVDGVDVRDLGFKDAIQHIRGLEGTEVRLRVRQGAEVIDLGIRRRRVRVSR